MSFPITKEFLEEILQNKIASFKITIGSNPGDNYLSVILAIQVELLTEESSTSTNPTLNSNPTIHHLIAKTYPLVEECQLAVNEMNAFWKEVNLYREYIPELTKLQEKLKNQLGRRVLKIPHPPFVAGNAINYSEAGSNVNGTSLPMHLNNFLIMIDIKKTYGYEMLNKRNELDFNHVSIAVQELAKIHALGWAYKEKEKLTDLSSKFPYILGSLYTQKETVRMLNDNFNLVSDILKIHLESNADVLGETEITSRILKGIKRVAEIGPEEIMLSFFPAEGIIDEKKVCQFMKCWESEQHCFFPNPWVLTCHGDTWINNMLFKYGDSHSNETPDKTNEIPKNENPKPTEMMFVDLQLYREGCPTTDLAFLLYTSTTQEFRQLHLKALLQQYHEQFLEYCEHLEVEPLKEFTLKNLQWRFKRAKLLGFMVACFYLPIILPTPEDAEQMGSVGSFKATKSSKLILERIMGIVDELIEDNIF